MKRSRAKTVKARKSVLVLIENTPASMADHCQDAGTNVSDSVETTQGVGLNLRIKR